MARGEGQHLDALAKLLEIADEHEAAFRAFTQQHFAALYPDDRVTASDMLITLSDLMARDSRFAAYATS
jgi:hypothetical protein